MPPMALSRRRPAELEPLQPGAAVDLGEPIGEAETIYTLTPRSSPSGTALDAGRQLRLSLPPKVLEPLASWQGRARSGSRKSPRRRLAPSETVSVHLCDVTGASGRCAPGRHPGRGRWGLGGGIVSTASPAAAAVRLLARRRISRDRGAAARALHRPGRDVRRAGDAAASASTSRRWRRSRLGRRVGVPTEIKDDEYRVALTPAGGARARRSRPRGAGPAGRGRGKRDRRRRLRGPGRPDRPRRRRRLRRGRAGAEGEGAAGPEVALLRAGQTLFTYLHLAAGPS